MVLKASITPVVDKQQLKTTYQQTAKELLYQVEQYLLCKNTNHAIHSIIHQFFASFLSCSLSLSCMHIANCVIVRCDGEACSWLCLNVALTQQTIEENYNSDWKSIYKWGLLTLARIIQENTIFVVNLDININYI